VAFAWPGYWYLNSSGDLVPLYDINMGSSTITGNITADTLTTLKIKAKSGKKFSIGAGDTLWVADGGALNSWVGLCAEANGSAGILVSDSIAGNARRTWRLQADGAWPAGTSYLGLEVTNAAGTSLSGMRFSNWYCNGAGTLWYNGTNGGTFYIFDANTTGLINFLNGDSAGGINISKSKIWGHANAKIEIDSVKAGMGLSVGTGTMITGIYTGNATGWTLNNTIDTNLVSGATAASRIGSLTLRAATATLTAPLCGRTAVDTLFISCVAADTAAVRAGSVDYLIFK
jgi:hypothetical protein